MDKNNYLASNSTVTTTLITNSTNSNHNYSSVTLLSPFSSPLTIASTIHTTGSNDRALEPNDSVLFSSSISNNTLTLPLIQHPNLYQSNGLNQIQIESPRIRLQRSESGMSSLFLC